MKRKHTFKIALVTVLMALECMNVTAYGAENSPNSAGTPQVGAKSAILMDAKNGRVLFEQNSHDQLPMASTTKIMTTLITLEQADLETYFTVDPVGIRVEGSSMGLLEGDQVNFRTLAYGMLLPSGNDAANTAAIKIGGSIPAFIDMMNERAEELGLENTHYVTPSGLDADGHYSSSYDLALLTHYAMQNSDFKEIMGLSRAKVQFGNPPYERWLKNHNKLLEMYEPCIGVKTGFTDAAKRCLVSAAHKDDMELIVVTMNSPDDFSIHTALYEQYFSLYENVDMSAAVPDLSVPVVNSGDHEVQLGMTDYPIAALTTGETKKLQVTANVPKFLYAPVKKGDYIGSLTISVEDEPVFTTHLIAEFDVGAKTQPKEKQGLFDFLKGNKK